jgi:hypothetical protein
MNQVYLIFEDQELQVVKNLIDNSQDANFVLVRCQQYGKFRGLYPNANDKNIRVCMLDIFLPPYLTAEFLNKFIESDNLEILGAINLSEKCQYYAQELFSLLGVSSLNPLLCKDKFYMKEKFREFGLITPEFSAVFSNKDIEKFLKDYPSGILLKLRNSDSCREIISISLLDEIEQLKIDFSSGWLVEEKIGFEKKKELAIDVVVSRNKILDYFVTEYPTPLLETVHTREINGNITHRKISDKWKKMIDNALEKFVKKSNVNSAVMHLEVFISETEIIFSEVGFRLGGGGIIHNHERAFGIKYYQYLKNLLNGINSKLEYTNNEFTGELLLPIEEGRIYNFTENSILKKIPFVEDVNYFYQSGDIITKNNNSFECFGRVLFRGQSLENIRSAMDEVNENFILNMERT